MFPMMEALLATASRIKYAKTPIFYGEGGKAL